MDYSGELREFNLGDWPKLRNRDDFNTIYWLPASQRSSLERVYLDGRDLAIQLSSLLSSFNDVSRHPTFDAFVGHVEDYASSGSAKLERTLAAAEAILPDLADPPWAIQLMIELARRQLAVATELNEWLRAARKTSLHGPAAGPAASAPPRLRPTAGVWERHRGALIAWLLAAAVGGILAVVLL